MLSRKGGLKVGNSFFLFTGRWAYNQGRSILFTVYHAITNEREFRNRKRCL